MTRDQRPRVDPGTAVDLGDGWLVALCIGPDGEAWPWLVSPGHTCDQEAGCSGACCAPHEQIGPLPSDVRIRLEYRHRCGAPTASGWPCQQILYRPGRCHWHRQVAG